MSNLTKKVYSTPPENTYSIGIIFIASLIIFCQHSWVPGFFHDGYLYAALGKHAALLNKWLVPFSSHSIYFEFDQHPPLVFILEGLFFKAFGVGFTQARLFGALWAVLSVVGLSIFLKKQEKKSWAYLAGVIFLIMPSFIKKSRFPNLDIALTFSFIITYWAYYRAWLKGELNKKNGPSWQLTGLMWGIALLIKGFPALMIPVGITFHLIFTKRFMIEIKKNGPWQAMIIGIVVFSIWPLALFHSHKFYIFQQYLNAQLFSTIVEGRGSTGELNPLAYLVHLLKYSGPWLLLLIYGIYRYFKKKKADPLYLLFICWFFSILIPFSILKWKYSHYILPLYPAFAALAAWPLLDLTLKRHQWISYIFKRLVVTLALILLIFPLTNKSQRDKELFQIKDRLEQFKVLPKSWIIIEDAYPFWHVANFSAFVYSANPYGKDRSYFEQFLKGTITDIIENPIFLLKRELFNKLKKTYPESAKNLKQLIYFPKSDLLALVRID